MTVKKMWTGVAPFAWIVALALFGPGLAFAQGPPRLSNAGPVLESLGKQAQNESLPEAERLEIIDALGKWGTDDVRAPLVALLTDRSEVVRAGAARALGWADNREAVPALRQRLDAPGET